MEITRKTMGVRLSAFIMVLLLCSMGSAMAKESIGVVLLSVGEVTADDAAGEVRKLKRRSKLYAGDTITTESGSRCQVRFSDGSLLSLPEASQLRVDEYEFGASDKDNEKAVYSLLKGGMRTITGAIGKKDPDNYRVNTPVATIGIRGTAYHAFLHRLPSGEIQLYGGVNHGVITVGNDAGAALFGLDQNFRVLSAVDLAQALLKLPDFYPLVDELPSGSSKRKPGGARNISERQLSDEDILLLLKALKNNTSREFLGSLRIRNFLQSVELTDGSTPSSSLPAPSGSMVGVSFAGFDAKDGFTGKSATVRSNWSNEIYLDSVDGINRVPVGVLAYDANCSPCAFVPGTATLSPDVGGDATLGVNWGRWDGDFIVFENGSLTQTSGSFHYIYTPNTTPLSAILARTGQTSYNLLGGTKPTDQNGTVGTLTWFSIDVDFDFQEIMGASLSGDVGGQAFNAWSGAATSFADALTETGIAVDDATNGLTGTVHMQFVGPGAEGIAASYGLQSSTLPSATAISGTALLEDVGPAF